MENFNSPYPRRRADRIALPIPVRVESKESKEITWNEITRFQTISPCGAGFILRREVKVGQLLFLTAPIPQKLRQYDFSEQQYRIWGVARYCNLVQENPDLYQIGVAFVGKYPPLSYHENPYTLYDLSGFNKQGFPEINETAVDFAKNIRQPDPRFLIPFEVFLEVIGQSNNIIASETAISENVSVGGAAIFSNLDVKADDIVRVRFKLFNIPIMAKVRNRRIAPDGTQRIHLEFLDRQLPLEGMS